MVVRRGLALRCVTGCAPPRGSSACWVGDVACGGGTLDLCTNHSSSRARAHHAGRSRKGDRRLFVSRALRPAGTCSLH